MLDERSIKAAVIDRLFSTGALENAVLINEMVYANWSRRADLAVANGHLHAFEIKSDFDSLKRLDGQIAIYLERFDKLTLVVSPRFLDVVLKTVPSRVAVWSAIERHGKVELKVIRDGRREKVENREILIDFLLREELYRFLLARGVAVRSSDSRSRLVSLAKEEPTSRIRAFLLQALKERYEKSFTSFSALREGGTSPEHLAALRKTSALRTRVLMPVRAAEQPHSQLQQVRLDLSRLFPDGQIPTDIPTSIVVRAKVNRRRPSNKAKHHSHPRSSSSSGSW